MNVCRLGAAALVTLVLTALAVEVHGRADADATCSTPPIATSVAPTPPDAGLAPHRASSAPRPSDAGTARPRASSAASAVDALDEDDARALVAALLLDGARHGWHAR